MFEKSSEMLSFCFCFSVHFCRFVTSIRHQQRMRPLPLRLNQHQPKSHELKRSKFIDGIRTSQMKSHTCKNTKWTWIVVRRWCWMRCCWSKMRSIQRWHSGDRVVRAFVARARWISAARIRWRASAKSIRTWVSHAKFIRCRTCMWCAIWCRTCPTFTNNIHQFSHGCSESELRASFNLSSIAFVTVCPFACGLLFLFTGPMRRKAMHNTCRMWMTVSSSTVCTSAFCVHAVRHHARRTGGMRRNIWGQPSSCRPIAGLSIHVMNRPMNDSIAWRTHSVCIDAIRLWTAPKHAQRFVLSPHPSHIKWTKFSDPILLFF